MAINNVRTFIDKRLDKETILDRMLIDDVLEQTKKFGTIIKNNDPVTLGKEKYNEIYLEPGDHKGFTSDKLGTIINAAAGATFTAPVICDNGSTTTFINCTFIQTKANTNALVELREGSRAVFQNCSFRRFDVRNKQLVGEVSTTNAAFVHMNTSIAGETLFTMSNCSFFAEADSGAQALFFDIGTAAGAGFFVLGVNKTTPLVPIGGGIIAIGVI